VLVTGALNSRPAVALRLLTWTTPALPLGAWMAAVAAGGAALSGGATALALRQQGPALRRQVRRDGASAWERDRFEPGGYAAGGFDAGGYEASGFETGGFDQWGRQEPPRRDDASIPNRGGGGQAWAGPDRRPGEPPPTVSVPFRVIRRPAQSSPASPQAARQAAGSGRRATAVAEPIAEPVAAWEDWANDNLEDW
jgi:hypothetical protein